VCGCMGGGVCEYAYNHHIYYHMHNWANPDRPTDC